LPKSERKSPAFIIDYDAEGNMVGFEILDASRRVSDPSQMEFHGSV